MPPPPEQLTTPRLRLTLLTRASLEPALGDLHELRTFESVMRWTRTGTIDPSRDFTRDWSLTRINTGCTQYLVELPISEVASTSTDNIANGSGTNSQNTPKKFKVIGAIGVVTMPEIGYLMHPSYYGKGYATEAIACMMQAFWHFAELKNGEPAPFAKAEIDATNGGSRRVLEKCGFQKVGEGVDGDINVEHWRLVRPGTTLPDLEQERQQEHTVPGAGIA